MAESCEFCLLNKTQNEYVLYETEYWTVYLADNQNYPGRCIIPLKRHCGSLSSITEDEWTDFHKIVINLERSVKEQLNASNFNWTCLMNGGYSELPANPHVHFHFIPRYFGKSCSADPDFKDENIANHYTLSADYQLSTEKRRELVKSLSEKLRTLSE